MRNAVQPSDCIPLYNPRLSAPLFAVPDLLLDKDGGTSATAQIPALFLSAWVGCA